MKSVHLTKAEQIAIRILLATAFLTALAQLLYNRSLWVDEAVIAVNIIDRGFLGLLKPLDHLQLAPPLWLWLVKASSLLIPNQEAGMRLPSFIAYLATLWIYLRLLKRNLSSGIAVVVGLAVFIFNRNLLFYSGETKQFMTEAFVVILLIQLATDDEMEEGRKLWACAIAGSLGILLSMTCVMVLPAAMAALFFGRSGRLDIRFLMKAALVGVCWLAVFACYYFFFLYDHPATAVKKTNFEEGFGITPSILPLKNFLFFHFTFFKLFIRDFGFTAKNAVFPSSGLLESGHLAAMGLLLLLGIWQIIRTRIILLVVLIPTFVHLVLSYLHLYPLVPRLYLHSYPLIAFLVAMGVERIYGVFGTWMRTFQVFVFATLAVLGVLFISKNKGIEIEESRPVLKSINEKSRPGDALSLYMHSGIIYNYYFLTGRYKPTGPVYYFGEANLDPSAPVRIDESILIEYFTKTGRYKPLDSSVAVSGPGVYSWQRQFAELPVSKGPFWIFFVHVKDGDDRNILDSARAAGLKITDSAQAKGASAYRFSR
jgi:hypothetical protein